MSVSILSGTLERANSSRVGTGGRTSTLVIRILHDCPLDHAMQRPTWNCRHSSGVLYKVVVPEVDERINRFWYLLQCPSIIESCHILEREWMDVLLRGSKFTCLRVPSTGTFRRLLSILGDPGYGVSKIASLYCQSQVT